MNDHEVDREKATVEDPPPNNGEVDREKATVEDRADVGQDELFSQPKWTVRLHIQDNPDRHLIKGIPTESKCYEWNTPVTFGRGQDAKIFLNDERASRLHLHLTGQILSNADVCFTITNLNSTNGVSVNNHNITADKQRINIKTGDVIGISCLSFKVEITPGQNMQNFVLEFVQPCENNPNAGVVAAPNNVVFLQPQIGPLLPGFQGPVFVPVPAIPAGAVPVPVNADIPWSRSGVGPAQPFGNMVYPQGYGGAAAVQVLNPPIPVNPPPHRPVQEVEAPEQKQAGHKAVTKQPSETSDEDSLSETAGKPLQDTQRPKDID